MVHGRSARTGLWYNGTPCNSGSHIPQQPEAPSLCLNTLVSVLMSHRLKPEHVRTAMMLSDDHVTVTGSSHSLKDNVYS